MPSRVFDPGEGGREKEFVVRSWRWCPTRGVSVSQGSPSHFNGVVGVPQKRLQVVRGVAEVPEHPPSSLHPFDPLFGVPGSTEGVLVGCCLLPSPTSSVSGSPIGTLDQGTLPDMTHVTRVNVHLRRPVRRSCALPVLV